MSEPEHLVAELRRLRDRVEALEGLLYEMQQAVERHRRSFMENAPSWVVSTDFDRELWLISFNLAEAHRKVSAAAGEAIGAEYGMREVEAMRAAQRLLGIIGPLPGGE